MILEIVDCRSIRKYLKTPIEDEKVQQMIESGCCLHQLSLSVLLIFSVE